MPYVKPEHILNPPTGGWPLITRELIVEHCNKSEEVYELTKHLPYVLEHRGMDQEYLLKPYSALCDSHEPRPDDRSWVNMLCPPYIDPLPVWTLPMTFQTEDLFGTYAVLDVTDGTITEMGNEPTIPNNKLYPDQDPRSWRNNALYQNNPSDATLPITTYFQKVTDKFRRLEYIGHPEPRWQRITETVIGEGPHADEDDVRMVQNLKRIYLEHGWPDVFDRAGCDNAVRKWLVDEGERVRREQDKRLAELLAASEAVRRAQS
ncbi:hypothetical protein K461DRAFT_279225 [Myriangium duriaei CBS 260.36]|uniref:Uncharacterized protein n=1 Tax=Myriangium duriaei CBS 260.36 TaxID=1168546 RepID=A0A9P4IZU1_9PEZI|nr:hypothetical protein K461DRAFT_279225 [Myriangium duriaei CBS 260.36]